MEVLRGHDLWRMIDEEDTRVWCRRCAACAEHNLRKLFCWLEHHYFHTHRATVTFGDHSNIHINLPSSFVRLVDRFCVVVELRLRSSAAGAPWWVQRTWS